MSVAGAADSRREPHGSPTGTGWEKTLDAPYRGRETFRHVRALLGLLLIPVGVVILLALPWSSWSDETLWMSLFVTTSILIAVPAAGRMWSGEDDPEPLPPGPGRR